MQPHNLARQAQADTRPARFGRKERNENVVGYFRRDTRAVVRHRQDHLFAVVHRSREIDARIFGVERRFDGVFSRLMATWLTNPRSA